VEVGAEYNEKESEFLKASEKYRTDRHLRFLSAVDYLRIAESLGYKKSTLEGDDDGSVKEEEASRSAAPVRKEKG
jgi:hypothetical protein